ncbi:hypothetical protein AC239_34630 [Bacteroides fragilis]|nr:hypothetical protein AC239_34630 [Bacteroides fragilis]
MFWAPLANWGFVIAGNFRIFLKSYTPHNNDDNDDDINDDNDNYEMLCQKLAKRYYCVQLRM